MSDHQYKTVQEEGKLTDRIFPLKLDQFVSAMGLPAEVDALFPSPGSNRGYLASRYVRTLITHFTDGGRYLEDMRRLRTDGGFTALLPLEQIPTPSAVGGWLRRTSSSAEGSAASLALLSRSAEQFARGLGRKTDLTIDVDATLIESEKGDATMGRKGFKGYSAMLAMVSDGSGRAACPYGKLRGGHVSPKKGILEALQESLEAVPAGEDRSIYFRADGAAYQSDILDWCEAEEIGYTVTGRWSGPVAEIVFSLDEEDWRPLPPKERGEEPIRDIAEFPRLVQEGSHVSRTIIWREPTEAARENPQTRCFDRGTEYGYGVVVTNIPRDEMSAAEVLRHHQDRGNTERHIGEIKDDLGLAHMPTGDRAANELYLRLGLLTYNLVGLMSQLVLPPIWTRARIRTLRDRLFRAVGHVIKTARQWWLKLSLPSQKVRRIQRIESRIEGLPPPEG